MPVILSGRSQKVKDYFLVFEKFFCRRHRAGAQVASPRCPIPRPGIVEYKLLLIGCQAENPKCGAFFKNNWRLFLI